MLCMSGCQCHVDIKNMISLLQKKKNTHRIYVCIRDPQATYVRTGTTSASSSISRHSFLRPLFRIVQRAQKSAKPRNSDTEALLSTNVFVGMEMRDPAIMAATEMNMNINNPDDSYLPPLKLNTTHLRLKRNDLDTYSSFLDDISNIRSDIIHCMDEAHMTPAATAHLLGAMITTSDRRMLLNGYRREIRTPGYPKIFDKILLFLEDFTCATIAEQTSESICTIAIPLSFPEYMTIVLIDSCDSISPEKLVSQTWMGEVDLHGRARELYEESVRRRRENGVKHVEMECVIRTLWGERWGNVQEHDNSYIPLIMRDGRRFQEDWFDLSDVQSYIEEMQRTQGMDQPISLDLDPKIAHSPSLKQPGFDPTSLSTLKKRRKVS